MQVVFWTSISGDSPITEFIDSIPIKAQKKIVRTLELIEKHGMGFIKYFKYCTKVEDGLYELKIRFDKIFYRILLIIKKAVCYILHIFKKKTNKIPRREIGTALVRARSLSAII